MQTELTYKSVKGLIKVMKRKNTPCNSAVWSLCRKIALSLYIYSNSKYFFGVNYKTNINRSKHLFIRPLS